MELVQKPLPKGLDRFMLLKADTSQEYPGGMWVSMLQRLTVDEDVEGSMDERAGHASRVAEKIALERSCTVLVALFDPQRPQAIHPLYFVSPEGLHRRSKGWLK